MKEIERKFLVIREKMPMPVDGEEVRQGYIAIDDNGNEVRIREKGEKLFLTIKSAGEMVRGEAEMEISQERFAELWPFTAGRTVEKMRYKFRLDGGLICELDVFSGRHKGLVIAEVEFKDEGSANSFTPPEWFGEEVTSDSRYKNKNLASEGI